MRVCGMQAVQVNTVIFHQTLPSFAMMLRPPVGTMLDASVLVAAGSRIGSVFSRRWSSVLHPELGAASNQEPLAYQQDGMHHRYMS